MGLIHIYHGNGKGKTTASLGLSLRMAGLGKKVLFSQFLKCGDSSEIKALKEFEEVKVLCSPIPHGFFITLSDKEKEDVKREIGELFSKVKDEALDKDLIVMDEILDAVGLGLIEEEALIYFLKVQKEKSEIVLTGRNPSDNLRKSADYITNMEKEKHPFDKGYPAREGIEY